MDGGDGDGDDGDGGDKARASGMEKGSVSFADQEHLLCGAASCLSQVDFRTAR